ncbi:hypothetical protein FAZ19_06570 [Sphingobacterium alkalisoli]|uniref:Uncharacterized protein n=1 Tax=Sphingobacterium alkalisoli TaxID=1874115 RepID=A0A4U0H865_9SPHI|nr:hypothetical protein [Sphingobacterium alkalisoli]TJY66582.1 hypothetical protein FAZ19_06570 [Sphingobacterium alkalisoli]GGH15518.1 hypothetical protein GCM10011418_17270 [Sphingobacterium alkalisoli]
MKKIILIVSLFFGSFISAYAYNSQYVTAIANTPNSTAHMVVNVNQYCNLLQFNCVWETGASGSAVAYGDILIGEVYGVTSGSYSATVSNRYWDNITVYISVSGATGAAGTATISWG